MRWNRVISLTCLSTPQDCGSLDKIKAGQFPLLIPLNDSDTKIYVYISMCLCVINIKKPQT